LPMRVASSLFDGLRPLPALHSFPTRRSSDLSRLGRERGWPPMTREQFDALCGPRGALLVGSPQEVIDKILYQHEVFGHQRFLAQLSVGTIPHDKMLRAIELSGTEVAPVAPGE